jgi:hypothetical protein
MVMALDGLEQRDLGLQLFILRIPLGLAFLSFFFIVHL